MWLDYLPVGLYLGALIWLGVRGSRRVKDAADFAAAGEKYGAPVIFASLAASYVGGGFSSGNAARAFSSGIGSTLALMGFALAMMAIGRWLVPGVARFRGASTVGGILERDYGKGARALTGGFAFLSCAGVVAAQMEAMGLTFRSLLGVSETAGVLIGCGVVLAYTTLGGMQSVIGADMLQFALLSLGMPLLLAGCLARTGGLSGLFHRLPAPYFDPLNGVGPWGFLSLFLSLAVGEALAPPYTQRLLIGRSPAVTARATVWSGLFAVPFFAVTGLIGLAAYVLDPAADPASAMPRMILRVLPAGLRGLVIAAMVSVILSAADGFLNGAALGLVEDLLIPLFPATPPRVRLGLLRYVNFLTGAGAVALALLLPGIFEILFLAYSFWCPVLLVPLAAAFRGVAAPRPVFYAAAVAGFLTALLWDLPLARPLGVEGSVVGLAVNALLFFGGILITKMRKRAK